MLKITTKEECQAALSIAGGTFRALPPNFQNDIDIVKYALAVSSPLEFNCIPLSFQNDKSLALLAAQQPGAYLKDFPRHFQQDSEVVMAGLKANPINYFLIKDDFKQDKEMILLTLQNKISGSAAQVKIIIDDIALNLGVIISKTAFEQGKRSQAPSPTESTQQELLALTQHLIALEQHQEMEQDRKTYMKKLDLLGQGKEPIKNSKSRLSL